MDARNRDWGRASVVDYVPFAGALYRFYWCYIARSGAARDASGDWDGALAAEANRLFVASVSTATVIVFLALGGTEGGVEPAILFAAGGLFVHRVAEIARAL